MERLISPQPVSWPRLHLIPVSTWHPLVCAASQNPNKPGVKTQAAALAANGAAQISTCRSSVPLRGGAAGARGINPIFWGEALTLGCSRSLPRSCSENLTFRATRGLPGVAEQDRDLSPAVASLPPELTWLQGRRVLGQVHPTEPSLWAQTKAQRKVWLPTLLPLASPAAASPPGPFRGSFHLRTHKRGARDTVTRFRGAAAPPRAGHGPGSSGEASGHLGELLGWHQNCPGCPWECSRPCLCSLPLPGHGSFISGC